jgi:hypothetical protein
MFGHRDFNVDVLVTFAAPGTQAAKSATATIPIVMAVTADAVGTGLIASLAHPGSNVTGTTVLNPELGSWSPGALGAARKRPLAFELQRRGYAARDWVLPGSSASVLHGRWPSCGVAEKARIGRDLFRSEDVAE